MAKRRTGMADSSTTTLTCNLTHKTISIYQDYYESKIKQYGSEEKLKKFYIQSKIINLLKRGYSLDSIANSLGFEFDPSKEAYYEELTKFHRYNNSFVPTSKKAEKITYLKTAPEVSDFIDRFKKVVPILG